MLLCIVLVCIATLKLNFTVDIDPGKGKLTLLSILSNTNTTLKWETDN